jgi:hypothetical protein
MCLPPATLYLVETSAAVLLLFKHVLSYLGCAVLCFTLQSLRETYNTAKYEEVVERINGRLGPEYDIDRSAAASCYHSLAI